MGCRALDYYEQKPLFTRVTGGGSRRAEGEQGFFLSTGKAAQRSRRGNENSCAVNYKFGFNGQMKVNEIAGTGNHLDYGARGRDPRLGGGWWSVDPHASSYPSLSPYSAFANNPINVIDPDGRDIHLVFENDAAKNAYIDLVNNSLGGKYKISVVTVRDVKGYTNKVVLKTGAGGKQTAGQANFYKYYNQAIKNKAVVRQSIVQKDVNTVVGSFYSGKVDVADIIEFDKAGKGAATSAGALIHETIEQLEKSKQGLGPNEWSKTSSVTDMSPEFQKDHEKATKAENAVNGNERRESEDYFLEKDGTKTQQDVAPTEDGGVNVFKTVVP